MEKQAYRRLAGGSRLIQPTPLGLVVGGESGKILDGLDQNRGPEALFVHVAGILKIYFRCQPSY
jgi:hypothetical protein